MDLFGKWAGFVSWDTLASPGGLLVAGGILVVLGLLAFRFVRAGRLQSDRTGYDREAEGDQDTMSLSGRNPIPANELEAKKREMEDLLAQCREATTALSAMLTAFEDTFDRAGGASCPKKAIPGLFVDLETDLRKEVDEFRTQSQSLSLERRPTAPFRDESPDRDSPDSDSPVRDSPDRDSAGGELSGKGSSPKGASSVKSPGDTRESPDAIRLEVPNRQIQATRRAVRQLLREGHSAQEIATELAIPLSEAELMVQVLSQKWNVA